MSGSGLPALSIHGAGPIGQYMTVELDGHKIPGMRRLSLDMSTDGISIVTLVVGVDEVEIDADVLAALQAVVTSQEPEDSSGDG